MGARITRAEVSVNAHLHVWREAMGGEAFADHRSLKSQIATSSLQIHLRKLSQALFVEVVSLMRIRNQMNF